MRSYLTKFGQKNWLLVSNLGVLRIWRSKAVVPSTEVRSQACQSADYDFEYHQVLAVFSYSFFPTLLNNDLSADFHRKLSENMYLNANKILYNDTSRLGWLILSWRLLTLTEDEIELVNTTKRPKNSLQDQKNQTLIYSNMCLKSHLTLYL